MQVTETSADGLKREYKVVISAEDLATKLEGQLDEMKDKVRINGFRPGKVPKAHLKRLYGRSIMSEVLQTALGDVNRKIVEDNKLRLATEPKVDFAGGEDDVAKAFEAKGDLAFTVAVETLPTFDVGNFSDVEVEKLTADVSDEEVEKAMTSLADRNRAYTDKEGDKPVAAKGDRVTIDFVGKIDGEPFDGGAGTDHELVLGSNSFIPGFEDQLVGAAKGETKTVNVSFPEAYAAARLAGKPAAFEVTVKNVSVPGEVAMDEAFAKTFNFDSVDDMKAAIRKNMEGEFERASRERTKRRLLDALDKRYTFELPQGLVEQEFDGIWRQLLSEQQASGTTFEAEDTTEEAAKAEYRKIAERRVRLGLVLAEAGEAAGVKVEDNEVTQALVERARAYPGQEKEVWEFYSKNPQAMAQIRAPIFEDKVVDHILGQAKLTEKKISKEDLFKNDDETDTAAA